MNEGARGPRSGPVAAALLCYTDIGGSMLRRFEPRPSLFRIYLWMALGGVIIWLGWSAMHFEQLAAQHAEASTGRERAELIGRTIGGFVGQFTFTPFLMALYGILIHFVLRMFRGQGRVRETVAANAWAMLLMSPLVTVVVALRALFLQGLGAVAATALNVGVLLAGLVAGQWIWASCLTAVHGYQSRLWLFIVAPAAGVVLGAIVGVAAAIIYIEVLRHVYLSG